MDRICGKCARVNDDATWTDAEACPFCGAIYAKVDQHLAVTHERQVAAAQKAAENAAQLDALCAATDLRNQKIAANAAAARKRRLASSVICAQCGTVGSSKTAVRGSTGLELVLWLLSLTVIMLPVAIIYSVWRMGSRYKRCRVCGSEALMPIGTPAGRRLYESFHR